MVTIETDSSNSSPSSSSPLSSPSSPRSPVSSRPSTPSSPRATASTPSSPASPSSSSSSSSNTTPTSTPTNNRKNHRPTKQQQHPHHLFVPPLIPLSPPPIYYYSYQPQPTYFVQTTAVRPPSSPSSRSSKSAVPNPPVSYHTVPYIVYPYPPPPSHLQPHPHPHAHGHPPPHPHPHHTIPYVLYPATHYPPPQFVIQPQPTAYLNHTYYASHTTPNPPSHELPPSTTVHYNTPQQKVSQRCFKCNKEQEHMECSECQQLIQVVFVDTVELVLSVVKELQSAERISFDVEGVDLSRTGAICQVQAFDGNTVYVFDVWRLKEAVFENGLRQILESPKPIKLMYDCRRDSDALFHQYGIKLSGVIDLQVVETLVRYKQVGKCPNFVKGLERAISDYQISHPAGYGELRDRAYAMYSFERGGQPEAWTFRPIPKDLLAYSAEDVKCIYRLYTEKFSFCLSDAVALLASQPRLDEFRSQEFDTDLEYEYTKVNFDPKVHIGNYDHVYQPPWLLQTPSQQQSGVVR